MNDFFQDVGAIKAAMGNIRRNIKQIEEKYIQSLSSVNTEQGNSILIFIIYSTKITTNDLCIAPVTPLFLYVHITLHNIKFHCFYAHFYAVII